MSTELSTYNNYMNNWDQSNIPDDHIQSIIDEHHAFTAIGKIEPDAAIDSEFSTLIDLATAVRNLTVAEDAFSIAADAGAILSMWTFGIGVAVFMADEVAATIDHAQVSKESAKLTAKMSTIDVDIGKKIGGTVSTYITKYFANNKLIKDMAKNSAAGMDTTQCRSILFQFMSNVEKKKKVAITVKTFKQGCRSSKLFFDSPEITKVYSILDNYVWSDQSVGVTGKALRDIKNLNWSGQEMRSTAIGAFVMVSKMCMKVSTKILQEAAAGEEGDLDADIAAEVDDASCDLWDVAGRVAGDFAILLSVVNICMLCWNIADVVEQTAKMEDNLKNNIKPKYLKYYKGLSVASVKYAKIFKGGPADVSLVAGSRVAGTCCCIQM